MLRLRTYKNSDAEKIVSWLQDKTIFSRWSFGMLEYPLTVESFQKFMVQLLEDERTWLLTAMDETGEPVGFFGMTKADYVQNSVHLCYIVVSDRCRGKGYGTRMLMLALQYATELLQMERVTLRVFAANEPARHVYQKVGFRFESREAEYVTSMGQEHEVYRMAYEINRA